MDKVKNFIQSGDGCFEMLSFLGLQATGTAMPKLRVRKAECCDDKLSAQDTGEGSSNTHRTSSGLTWG